MLCSFSHLDNNLHLNCSEVLALCYKPAFQELHEAMESSMEIPHNFTFQSNQLCGKSAHPATWLEGMAHLYGLFFFYNKMFILG